MDIASELQRTNPDYVVYVPKSEDGSTGDTGNEHFQVFDGPDGSLMAVWTQSTYEGQPDQHIAFARSDDAGKTWTPPRTLAGPDPQTGVGMSSWEFPLVSKSGRIYVGFNRHVGVNDVFSHTTGVMVFVYSDDNGVTWSGEQTVPMPKSKWDNPDPAIPGNWIIWQKPLRLSEEKHLSGFTRWTSPAVRPPAPIKVWWANASTVEFMRFENIDDDPEPRDIEIRYSAADDDAIQVGMSDYPDVSVVQEPALVRLPDGRLFCTTRTAARHPYWTVSSDEGVTWSAPEPLRYRDGAAGLLHPCSPCPIYEIRPGEYFFLFHNHDGHFGSFGPMQSGHHRRPIYLVRGEFRPDAHQPVWFSEPKFLMDNGGIAIGYKGGRAGLAMYASVTYEDDGVPVLWYPDRKFFLLGKRITPDFLADRAVPA